MEKIVETRPAEPRPEAASHQFFANNEQVPAEEELQEPRTEVASHQFFANPS